MIQGVIFDCFGVLYIDPSHSFYEKHVKNYEQLRPELMSLNRAADYGVLSGVELSQAVADLTGLDESFVSNNIMGEHQRNDALLSYAQKLRPRYKLGVLSNIGPGSMESFFSKAERQQLFDAVVMSGEENLTKPHPRIFAVTAERLGLASGQCVMIDDSEENCAGADAAGMKAIFYQSNAQVIRELNELLGEPNA